MRRRIGAALLIFGALLLLASGGAALLHARQDEQAGRTARQAVTALQQLIEPGGNAGNGRRALFCFTRAAETPAPQKQQNRLRSN